MTYRSASISQRLKRFRLPNWLSNPKLAKQQSLLEVFMKEDPLLQKVLEEQDSSIFSDRLIKNYLNEAHHK